VDTPYHSKALPEGTVLREWRLEQVLGVGGFGIVYRARGVYFDELVAIKEYFPSAISDRQDGTTVTPTDSSSEEVYALGLQKFLEEAKVLWNLSKPERHPNIVSVRSLFEIHGTAYMVMDFESGVSLSQMLRDGRKFNEASLLALIRPIAEGLDRAHRAGVLHRDIKPANILVDDSARPVLIDFGSARFESGQATSTKVTFYTPPYAAIEQYVKTYPQGPWTDIYALGVALYQCVTGEKPPEVLERLHGGLGESLSARPWPGFSPAFARAVDAAMAIRPAERPQSIPEWLKLFDEGDRADMDDATRITVSSSPHTAVVPAAIVAETVAPADPEEEPETARRLPRWIVPAAAGLVVVLCVGIAATLLRPGGHPAATPAKTVSAAASAAAPAAAVASSPVIDVQPIVQDADALIATARRAGRPRSEVGALVGAKANIAALAAQIQGLASTPNSAAKVEPLAGQLTGAAVDMAKGEAAALSRASTGQLYELQHNLSGDAAAAAGATSVLAAARQAKGGLDAAIAAVSQASGAVSSMDAARQSLAAYGPFAAALGAANRVYLSARQQKEFDALEASARPISAEVIALAETSKPWLFASKARKDAYQLLQSNATRARADATQLDQLSASGRSTDLDSLNSAVARVTEIKSDLAALYASSYAAAHSQN
jgi:non-specific serine/threonine protein kinase